MIRRECEQLLVDQRGLDIPGPQVVQRRAGALRHLVGGLDVVPGKEMVSRLKEVVDVGLPTLRPHVDAPATVESGESVCGANIRFASGGPAAVQADGCPAVNEPSLARVVGAHGRHEG